MTARSPSPREVRFGPRGGLDSSYAAFNSGCGSPTITVQTGGTLQKTAGTGTSTISGIATTVAGYAEGNQRVRSPTANLALHEGIPTSSGNVLSSWNGRDVLSAPSRWPSVNNWQAGDGGTPGAGGAGQLTVASGGQLTLTGSGATSLAAPSSSTAHDPEQHRESPLCLRFGLR